MGKLSVDDFYFDQIDTESKAYFLGFLMADGSILKGSHTDNYVRVGLHISIQDLEILERFKEEIQADHKIFIGKKFSDCALRFVSERMVSDLAKYGVVPNKTGKELLNLTEINPDMHRHILRGLVDGDGWIYSGTSGAGRIINGIGICGSKDICEQFTELLHDNIRVSRPNASKVKDKNCYKLQYAALMEITKVAEYLYKDSTVGLSRKYDLASSFFS